MRLRSSLDFENETKANANIYLTLCFFCLIRIFRYLISYSGQCRMFAANFIKNLVFMYSYCLHNL